ncbi:MAG: AraC family transcriptional regulator [Chthoniobacteraceae bacterium]|nr:AraC family transcriptional regulator [Chthoniobacteraceae bacterium]
MSFPTQETEGSLFFQNSRLSQSAPGPCRLAVGDSVYAARIHHAEVGHRGEPLARRPPSHAHPVYHIVLATVGTGHFLLGGHLAAVERGTLVTTGPGESHGFSRVAGETACYAEVTFDFADRRGHVLEASFLEMLSLWAGQKSACRPLQHLSEPATAELEQRIEHLVRVGRSPSSELTFPRLSTALIQILESTHIATLAPAAPTMPWEKAYRLLLEDFARPLPVTELAERLGVHPDYLTRRFRKAYGMAPLAFQNWLRLEAAKTWLISSDYTLKEIAARVGFADPGYFARIFRRKMGVPPGQFRRAKRSE